MIETAGVEDQREGLQMNAGRVIFISMTHGRVILKSIQYENKKKGKMRRGIRRELK